MKKLAILLFSLNLPICTWAVEMSEQQLAKLEHSAALKFEQLERQHWHAQANVEKRESQSAPMANTESGKFSHRSKTTTLLERIRQVEDVALREAMLDHWLDEQQQKSTQPTQELEALQSLSNEPQQVLIPHHDMPHHRMPAFSVAQRATNLLAFRQRQARARELADDLKQLITAFQDEPFSEPFRTASLASRSIDQQKKQQLQTHFHAQLPSNPLAARPLLVLAQNVSPDPKLLADLIEYGDLNSARQSVRMIDPNPEFRHLAEQALKRPELGGLAIQAWINTGGEVDLHLWPLLADPDLGADAARALAERSERLIKTIETEINSASPTTRLRMLLALKLRNSLASRSLLEQLLTAEWLTEQQREEIAAWL